MAYKRFNVQRERIQQEMFEAYQTDWDKHHLLNNFDTNFTVGEVN